jgi:hypothetical protein
MAVALKALSAANNGAEVVLDVAMFRSDMATMIGFATKGGVAAFPGTVVAAFSGWVYEVVGRVGWWDDGLPNNARVNHVLAEAIRDSKAAPVIRARRMP